MADAFDAVSSTSGASVSSLTWAHTVTGTNTYLLVLATRRNGVNVTGITYNGVALTSLGTVAIIAAGVEDAFLYGLVNPATGTHDIVITYNGATNCYGGGISATGVNQSAPTGTLATNNANSNQASLTVTGATGDLAVAHAISGTAVNIGASADAPATTRWQLQTQNYSAGGCTDVGAASVAFGWGLPGGPDNWGMIGVSVKSSTPSVPGGWSLYRPYTLGAAIPALLSGGLFYYWRRRKQERPDE